MTSRDGVPLELHHKAEIESHFAILRSRLGEECPSEYTFANLYLFRAVHSYRYLPGPYPCVSGVTYDGARHLLPLFDITTVSPANLVELLSGYECYFPVSSNSLKMLDPRLFRWAAVANDADYLYPAQNFRHYKGKRLREKHVAMARLLLAESRIEAHRLAPSRVNDALRVLEQWMLDKDKKEGEADVLACAEALSLAESLGLESVVYYADTEPVGFLIAEILTRGVAVIHFAKGIDSHSGIYPYMFHHYCMTYSPQVRWLNFEQDLGVANLRRTKRSYKPQMLLDKFRVSLKSRETQCSCAETSANHAEGF